MFLNRQLTFLYVILAVSIGYLMSALGLGAPTSEGGLTPSFFPILVGAAAILFASVLIVQELRKPKTEDDVAQPATFTHLWVLVAIFFYVMIFRTVGYFISSWLFVLAMMLIFSSREKLLIKAGISAVIVGVAYVLFQQLFGVRLPTLWG